MNLIRYTVFVNQKQVDTYTSQPYAMQKYARCVVASSEGTFDRVDLVGFDQDEKKEVFVCSFIPVPIEMIAQVFALPTENLVIGHMPHLYRFRAYSTSHALDILAKKFPGVVTNFKTMDAVPYITHE